MQSRIKLMLYNCHKRPSQGGEPGIFYFFLTEKFIVPLMLKILSLPVCVEMFSALALD